MSSHSTFRLKRAAVSAGVLVLLTSGYFMFRPSLVVAADPTPPPAARGVACLGRIAPRDGIQRLSPPASSYPGLSPIASIRVRAGEKVKAGQVLATLENEQRLERAWQAADAQARVAETRLRQIEQGASAPERAAQQALVDELALQVEAARINHGRSEALKRDVAITDANFELTQLALQSRQKALEAARANLKRMQEVPEVDRNAARAQLAAAQAEAGRAKAELDQAFIRAPGDGEIVRINAQVGERPGADGVFEFGRLDPMYVFAEVDEADARRVRPGQKATITGAAFDKSLTGVVETIGGRVGRNHLYATDPASASDARVVEVKVRLDQPSPADRFLDATVNVVFQP